MTRESHNVAHVGHSGMCRNDDNGIDCSELQEKYSQLDSKRGSLMSRRFGTSYHPNDHYMRGPGPACAKNARNILKSNARPASLVYAPAGDAGPPFSVNDAEILSVVQRGGRLLSESRPAGSASFSHSNTRSRSASHALFLDQSLRNLTATAFSFLALGLAALPFFLGAVVYALFF